jgi:hypothetical protein
MKTRLAAILMTAAFPALIVADTGPSIELVFRLEVAGNTQVISLDDEGSALAAETLAAFFPGSREDGSPRYLGSGAWRLHEELSREDLQAELLSIAGLSERKRFLITVILDDSPETLWVGEELEVPGKEDCRNVRECFLFGTMCQTQSVCESTHTVEEGQAFAEIAALEEVTPEDLLAANPKRFHLDVYIDVEDGDLDVRFGESRLRRDAEIVDFLPALLHEVGHVADETRRSRDFGPDWEHFPHEVTTPAAAFMEGWAHWVGSLVPGRLRRVVEEPPPVAIEGTEEGQGAPGVYLTIAEHDRTLGDLVSNEAWVGASLRVLAELPPGRDGVEQAFVASNSERRRTLASFLEAWADLYPGHVDAAARSLAAEMEAQAGLVESGEVFAGLFAGDLPGGLGTNEVPRDRDYRPSSQANGTLTRWIQEQGEPAQPLDNFAPESTQEQ